MHILLVEDNDFIIKALKYLLQKNSYTLTVAKTIQEAQELLTNKYHLVILDLMLPDGSGLSFYKNYINKQIPTIVLSAKDEESDVVASLDAGADDYIIKPFRSNELLSRINNILRRTKEREEITIDDVTLNLATTQVFIKNKEIILTSLEYKLLALLMENAGHVVTRDFILDQIWDMAGKYVNDNTLTVYIKRIREKLGDNDIIKTVKGLGYRVDK